MVARKRNEVSYRLSPWGINLPSAMSLTSAQVQQVGRIFRRIVCVS
jgi:dTDP-4-amino-4,6-dideoxygalactose transaminase